MLNSRTLYARLIIAFTCVAIITALVGLIGWIGLYKASSEITSLGNDSIPSLLNLELMEVGQLRIRVGTRVLANDSIDDGMIRQQLDEMAAARKDYQKALDVYSAVSKTPEEEQLWRAFQEKLAVYRTSNQQIAKEAEQLVVPGADKASIFARIHSLVFNGDNSRAGDESLAALGKLLAYVRECYGTKAPKEAAAAASFLMVLVTVVSLLGIALAVGLGITMSRSIAKPLRQVIGGMAEGASQVASAANQVSSSSQQLAEGAAQQAAGLEETSSSMEEMNSMTQKNAEHARDTSVLMEDARKIVGAVNEHMDNMANAISGVTRMSDETKKIVKTIDEIAFQTNLLALNAAVEAARAGDTGAGFAVVADEVRNLAHRAAEAAKSTESLIDATIEEIQKSSSLTSVTQKAFQQNMEIAMKIGVLVNEIAAASQEQTQGIQQISKAVAEMDKVVQMNAANAEESSAAAEELNAQAEQMKEYVQNLVALVEGGSKGNRPPAARLEIRPEQIIH